MVNKGQIIARAMADDDEAYDRDEEAHERRVKHLKAGQGVGRRGGFGQLHDMKFQPIFKMAIDSVMRRNELPEDNIVKEKTTRIIVEDLHQKFVINCKDAWSKEGFWPTAYGEKMQWCSVADTLRKYIFGIYPRQVLPEYIEEVLHSIPDERWRSFFTQRLLVKHNHLVAKLASARECTINLMDLDGKITGPHVPKQPHEPEFFDRIKLLPLKYQVSEGEASDEGRHDVSDEAAREDGASHGASQNVRVSLRCGGEVIGSSRVKIPRPHGSVSEQGKSTSETTSASGTRARRKRARDD